MNVRFFIILIFILIVAGCGSDSGNFQSNPVTGNSGINLIYKFDESVGSKAINSGSDRYNGTILGASRVSGKLGNALQFGVTGARVEVAMYDSTTGFIPITFDNDTISVDAWIKLDTIPQGSIYHVIGSGYGGSTSFRLQINNGKSEFLLNDQTQWRSVITSNQTLSENTWYHIAITYNGTEAKTYISGVQDNAKTITYKVPVNSNIIYIGAINDGSSTVNEFKGIIDELRIIDQVRSADELYNYYQATK